jgi:biotin carboxyl carrier protein
LTVSVDVDGRRLTVEVIHRDGVFLVSIDGRQHEADVREIDGVMSLLVRSGTASNAVARSYEVSAASAGADRRVIHVDSVPVEVAIVRSRPSWARTSASHAAAAGPRQVVAPMPGKIVKVLVKAGDPVEPRQGLVVVEAMKMENELRARAAGRVVDVRAIEGASVEAGAILVILE